MELEQIIKRLDWLEDERRKDKAQIASLAERINRYENSFGDLNTQIQEVNGEVVRLTSNLTAIEGIENLVNELRVEFNRSLEGLEKKRMDREREIDKVHMEEMIPINKSLYDLKKGLEPIQEIKRGMQLRIDEEYRLSTLIEELDKKVDKGHRMEEDYSLTQRLFEEGRRQDSKRMTDVQGELAAVRKRVDDQRGKIDLALDLTHKLEAKLNTVQESDRELRQVQSSIVEKQNLFIVERDRQWKELKTKIEEMSSQSVNLDTQIVALDTTHRTVKKAIEQLEEIIQHFDRRANEITEMQRLMEERFRQDWVTFKADDQKRWANYSIAQEEKYRDTERKVDKDSERLELLEDLAQDLKDSLQQDSEIMLENLLQLQGTLNGFVEQIETRIKS